MENNFKMIVKIFFGFEDLLVKELQELGVLLIEKGICNVFFEGDIGFMYKVNLCCRIVIKILKLIDYFNVFMEEDIYKKVYDIFWENYMISDGFFVVNVIVFFEVFIYF